jgi:oxygen-independent coproporphyrinogen-3 oxidase
MPGVYISFPFCAQKCTFCNFASGVFPRELQQDYVAALREEVNSYQWARMPDTVYIGGGTPSLLEPAELRNLLAVLPGRPWKEATMEAAPGSLTADNVRAWREAGINRVSLGVQSFVKAELTATGRKHDVSIVAADCALLRGAGIENINIDLIAGLPNQTPATWQESLEWIERLRPPHVSVYMFEVDEDSRLGLEVLQAGSRYGASNVPPDDVMADLYQTAVDRLAALGIQRYEISNFAEPGMESLHNLKYWQLLPYAGFGADAHSFDGRWRSANVETAREYVDRWRAGRPATLSGTEANVTEERFFVGLRLDRGIEPLREEWDAFAGPINRFVDAGLLETDGRILKLTQRGVLLSNEVFQEFVSL